MKKVLLVQYSQTGQLTDVAKRIIDPLRESSDVEVIVETLRPKKAFPFPWPFFKFFDTFPESVYLDAPALEPLAVDPNKPFDLIILAYQVWFLSPSLPVTAFLQSAEGAALLKGKPVITVIACRNMWLMAQEQVKALISAAGGKLVGNVALIDEAGTARSFFATPIWMLTGKKGPHLFGLIPKAGVNAQQIEESRRFGERILDVFKRNAAIDEALLRNLGAVYVNEKLIASEKAARRSFRAWGALLRAAGPHGAFIRKPILVVYVLFLFTLIVTFIPLSVLIKAILAPFTRAHTAAQKAYFAQPSGE